MGKKKITLSEEHTKLVDAMWKSTDDQYANFMKSEKNARFNLAKSFFHTHTDLGSPKDAILTVDQYVETAYQMGARSISITDHGTTYAVYPLYYKCREYGIKLICGVEFYLCDDVEDESRKKHTRKHLVAYAKNMAGWKAICQLVTASNDRILKLQGGRLAYPCISKKLLQECIGPGTEGHGNVILTSACIGGVLTGISYQASTDMQNLALLENDYKKLSENVQAIKILTSTVAKIEKEILDLTPVAQAKYTKAINYLKHHPDEQEEANLKKKIAETEAAGQRLKELKKILKEGKKKLNEAQKVVDDVVGHKYAEASSVEYMLQSKQNQIKELKSDMVDPAEYVSYFEQEALWYDNLAGHGNWYIELQYHGISEEKLYMPYLVEIARKYHMPLIAANDAHMANKDDAEARKYITALRFNQWEPLKPGDTELYLKDDVSLYHALASVVPADAAMEAMNNREVIASQCNLELNKVEAYPVYSEN